MCFESSYVNRYLAATCSDNGVFISDDYGETWTNTGYQQTWAKNGLDSDDSG